MQWLKPMGIFLHSYGHWKKSVTNHILHHSRPLAGPQRFTDLLGYLDHLPKWSTQRLRELESSGIINGTLSPGRRQVWYKLTSTGLDLGAIVDALANWGYRYAMRPPIPGEVSPCGSPNEESYFIA